MGRMASRSASLLFMLLTFLAEASAAFPEVPYRLYNEDSVNQDDGSKRGLLQFFSDGFWGSVCTIGTLEAAVACRMLGYQGWSMADSTSTLPTEQLVWIDSVSCEGTEASFADCNVTEVNATECQDGYAMVQCWPNAKRTPDDAVAMSESSGAVYLFRHGIWGAICAEDFGIREATVVCRQLGLAGAATADYATDISQPSWVTNVTCTGTEEALSDCQHTYRVADSCPDGYATVTCVPNVGGEPALSIRLTGEGTCNKGRVEVYKHRMWGQVCSMDALGAAAVCRQLGLSGGAASVETSSTSSSSGQIVWVARATCEGGEESLADCTLNSTVLSECENEYAYVECKPPSATWMADDMCTTPGPCQQLPGSCSAAAGTCAYTASPLGAPCPGGSCNGVGSCIREEDLPQWNVSFGLPYPYIDVRCWQDGACFQAYDASGTSRARGDNHFALVSVPSIGLSMVYDRESTLALIDIGREAISGVSNVTAALQPVASALLSGGNLSAVLLDDLVAYLAGGGGILSAGAAPAGNSLLGRRRLRATYVGLPTGGVVSPEHISKVMDWAFSWGSKIASVIAVAAEDAAQATAAEAEEVWDRAVTSVTAGVTWGYETGQAVKQAMKEAFITTKDVIIPKLQEIMNSYDDLDAAGLMKREAMCTEWTKQHPGYYAGSLTLSECKDGQATLSGQGLRGGDVTYECSLRQKDSNGDEYESNCVNLGENGEVFWGDGPSGPYPLVLIAGFLLDGLRDKVPEGNQILSGQDLVEAQRQLQELDFEAFADYNSLFWPAGMFHDWCYHHNPITYGKTKLECDQGLFETAMAICASDVDRWFRDAHGIGDGRPKRDAETCYTVARLYHLAVAGLHLGSEGESVISPGDSPWEASNVKVEYARSWKQAPGAKPVEGEDCQAQVPHCDLCITPEGSDHPLCLACTPPYVADGKGDCELVPDAISAQNPQVQASCGSVYAYYQAFDLKCDFSCPPEQRYGSSADWNLGCSCWDSACERIFCKLDSPQDDAQDPDVEWVCPVVSGRASCGSYPTLVSFLNNPDPPLSDGDLGEPLLPVGQAYADSDGYSCVLSTIKTLIDSWTPKCNGGDCEVTVQPMSNDETSNYVEYTDTGFQGEPRLIDGDCYVYSSMSKNGIFTTAWGSQLWLPSGTVVDFVGHKFTTSCNDWAMVRIALPPPDGSAKPSYILAYMEESCLIFDDTLNKCPESNYIASQGPFSCKLHEECCSGRCNCPPAVGGAAGDGGFELEVLGATLPSGAPLKQRIEPALQGATLYKKVCCE